MGKIRLTRGEAIKEHCKQCSGDSVQERRLCPVTKCPLWVFRNGVEEELPEPKKRAK